MVKSHRDIKLFLNVEDRLQIVQLLTKRVVHLFDDDLRSGGDIFVCYGDVLFGFDELEIISGGGSGLVSGCKFTSDRSGRLLEK